MSDGRPTIDELVVGDEPEAWADAGFTVDDGGTCRIGFVRIRLAGSGGGRGVLRWSVRGIDAPAGDAIDGLPTTASAPPAPEPAVHPNGVIGLDHVVVASGDGDRTALAISEATGLDIRRIRDTGTADRPMRQWFFRFGPVVLELVAPAAGGGSGPAGFFGLAMDVADIDALPRRYGDALTAPKDAVQPGRRIATLRHRAFDISVPIAFMSPDPCHH